MDCSTPGLPVHHQLPGFTQTHVHWVSDAIQPFHPLSSPSPAFNLSQHQGLFQWVSSSHQVAKLLEFQLQHQSFQWIFRTHRLVRYWVCLGPIVSSFFFIPLGGDRGKESSYQCGYYPWVRKIPWRRSWQPTPVFLPEKLHGQRSLAGYNPWGRKEPDTAEHIGNRNVYPTRHWVLEPFDLSGFTDSQLERNFCLRMNLTSSLIHIWLRWHLEETLDFKVAFEMS